MLLLNSAKDVKPPVWPALGAAPGAVPDDDARPVASRDHLVTTDGVVRVEVEVGVDWRSPAPPPPPAARASLTPLQKRCRGCKARSQFPG